VKTAKDYRKDYDDLTVKFTSLANHVTERLVWLANQHPDAVIKEYRDTKLKAGNTLTYRAYIDRMPLEEKIEYIRIIEKWLEDQNPVQQGTISFPE
jgi:hypothetical protein